MNTRKGSNSGAPEQAGELMLLLILVDMYKPSHILEAIDIS